LPLGSTRAPSEYHDDLTVPLNGCASSSFGSMVAESIWMRHFAVPPSAPGPENVS
jgi:hypothetical protein